MYIFHKQLFNILPFSISHLFLRTDQYVPYWLKEKGRDLTQSYDKSPYTSRNVKRAKWQHKQRHKKFDCTAVEQFVNMSIFFLEIYDFLSWYYIYDFLSWYYKGRYNHIGNELCMSYSSYHRQFHIRMPVENCGLFLSYAYHDIVLCM